MFRLDYQQSDLTFIAIEGQYTGIVYNIPHSPNDIQYYLFQYFDFSDNSCRIHNILCINALLLMLIKNVFN